MTDVEFQVTRLFIANLTSPDWAPLSAVDALALGRIGIPRKLPYGENASAVLVRLWGEKNVLAAWVNQIRADFRAEEKRRAKKEAATKARANRGASRGHSRGTRKGVPVKGR